MISNVKLNIPTSSNIIKSRNIYRTKANNPKLFYLLANINDNTTKSYFDNINDQQLNILYSNLRNSKAHC